MRIVASLGSHGGAVVTAEQNAIIFVMQENLMTLVLRQWRWPKLSKCNVLTAQHNLVDTVLFDGDLVTI